MGILDNIPAGNLVKVACPFCGSVESSKYRDIADIVKCKSCGAVYLRTRLNDLSLMALYQSYADAGSHMGIPQNEGEIRGNPLRRNEFLKELLEFTSPEGLLLDIGCGWGAFLSNAREAGFDTRGIELTQKTAEYGKSQLGLEISPTNFTEQNIENNSLSVITIIHTLEHLTAPKESIEKAYRALRPGGIFAGIVPNIESFASESLGDKWEWIDPFHHIVHFYPEFLEKALANAGFEILRLYTHPGDYNSAALREIVKNKLGIGTESGILNKIEEISGEGKGEEIRFFARKPLAGEKITKKGESAPSHLDEGFEKIEVDLRPGDNYEEKIHRAIVNAKGPSEIIVKGPKEAFPGHYKNWNGIRAVIEGEGPESDSGSAALIDAENKENTEKKDIDMSMDSMNRLAGIQGGFSDKPAAGKLPNPLPSPLKLNLGCGKDVREGFVNIDLYSENPAVVGMDIRQLTLPGNSADFILASDILEHFSHRQTAAILNEWHRVLKPGGEIEIRCPSLKLQARAYARGDWNADIASYMIFGGQTNPGDYHCIAFDEKSITNSLEKAGFDVISIEEHDFPQDQGYINLNMTVRASKKAVTEETGIDFESIGKIVSSIKEKKLDKTKQQEPDNMFGLSFGGPEEKEAGEKPAIEADSASGKKLNIVWEGSQFIYHSLALINREHCSNIIDSGQAELTIVPYENNQFEAGGNPKYEKLQKHDIRVKKDSPESIQKLPYAWIRHQWPPKKEEPKGAKWIIMQPWEFTALRKDFAELFNQADEIWAPSTYTKNCYVNSGVDFNKVQVVPNGIDPGLFKPYGDKYQLNTGKRFKFLFVGGTIFRKGIDILLKAYVAAFNSEDNTALVIKDMGGDTFYKGQNAKEYINNLKSRPGAPEIIYIDDSLSEEEMASLYRACDVFACPYRGEGFSLPTLEAMACGLPVIVPEGGATDDFADQNCGWFIKADKKSIGNEIGGEPLTGEAFLLEPDAGSTAEILRSVYADPSDVYMRGMAASYKARKFFTWKKATIKMFSRLDALYGLNMASEAEKKLAESSGAYIILGEAEYNALTGNLEEAKANYKKAMDAGDLDQETRAYAYRKLSLLELDGGDFNLFKNFAAKADELNNEGPDSMYIRSELHARDNEWMEALEELTKIFDDWGQIKYDSRLAFGLDGLLVSTGDALFETGAPDDALKLYTEALKFNSSNPFACYGSAKCFMQAGTKGEAKKMLEWAVKIKPDFDVAKNALKELNNE